MNEIEILTGMKGLGYDSLVGIVEFMISATLQRNFPKTTSTVKMVSEQKGVSCQAD